MYSRNQSRAYDEEDYDDDEMTEEYELYAYNLPPNYDGSRFRRKERKKPVVRDSSVQENSQKHHSVPHAILTDEHPTVKTGGMEYLKDLMSKKIGSEEMLIIALILILGAENDHSDTLFLLTLLLFID